MSGPRQVDAQVLGQRLILEKYLGDIALLV
jgi:hypothetical protein